MSNLHIELTKIVSNQSSRHGIRPKLIVLHSTESSNAPELRDLRAIGEWFDNPAAQASAHGCVDGGGNSARYVYDDAKAWACAAYNSLSLNLEQIGRASQTTWPEAQQHEVARWIVFWHRNHGIPIRKGRVFRGRVLRSGVVRHSDLGVLGGGHVDPGKRYPIRQVLRIAREYARDH